MGVGGQHHPPAALPPGKTRYPLYRRLGRPQGRSGRVRKISPPPEFDPQTEKLNLQLVICGKWICLHFRADCRWRQDSFSRSWYPPSRLHRVTTHIISLQILNSRTWKWRQEFPPKLLYPYYIRSPTSPHVRRLWKYLPQPPDVRMHRATRSLHIPNQQHTVYRSSWG